MAECKTKIVTSVLIDKFNVKCDLCSSEIPHTTIGTLVYDSELCTSEGVVPRPTLLCNMCALQNKGSYSTLDSHAELNRARPIKGDLTSYLHNVVDGLTDSQSIFIIDRIEQYGIDEVVKAIHSIGDYEGCIPDGCVTEFERRSSDGQLTGEVEPVNIVELDNAIKTVVECVCSSDPRITDLSRYWQAVKSASESLESYSSITYIIRRAVKWYERHKGGFSAYDN